MLYCKIKTNTTMKIYIAGSFTSEKSRKSLNHMIELVRKHYPNCELFVPMEHKVEGDFQKPDGTWNLSNPAWGRAVFDMDLKGLIESDIVIAMYTGHFGTTGTSWEIGYAYCAGKRIILYIPDWAKEENVSLMVLNSASSWMDEEGNIFPITHSWLKTFNQK
jgi:nucleoside 2-deoxyribosyltransferase